MSDHSSLGDRMKLYERLGSATDVLMPQLPIIVRLDGRAFHSFTRGLERPYDVRLCEMMRRTALALAAETNARMAYTQSDEITLLLYAGGHKSQVFFDGKRDKLNSILASLATLTFNRLLVECLPEKVGASPLFDSRAYTTPTLQEAVNCFVWREQDAVRNSVSMAAQAYFSHKSLHCMNVDQMQERLFSEAGINWNDYPAFFKRGQYIQRRSVLRAFTGEELESLPPRHAARTNPNLEIERSEFRALDLPRLTQVVNQMDVLFLGADPISRSDVCDAASLSA